MKFKEMPYTRPDPEKVKSDLAKLTEKLKAAQSYEEARAVFLEKEEKEKEIYTLSTLSLVRHTIDTRDEFYDSEQKFWNSFEPEVQEYQQAWLEAMPVTP